MDEPDSQPNRARPRWTTWLLVLGLFGVLMLMQWRGGVAPTPPVFDENQSFDQCQSLAAQSHKLVLVYATASWCGPCQTYKRTTLVDRGVVEWIRRHTEPVYLDIDRNQSTAAELGVSSIPVTILLQDGKEVSRLTGAASADEFLQWVKPWTPPPPSASSTDAARGVTARPKG